MSALGSDGGGGYGGGIAASTGGGDPSDARQRIQLLSKKNRELTATLGGEQARGRKMASRIAELEKQV